MEYNEIKNLAVIEVTVTATLELARRFGFKAEYGGPEMMSLQGAIYQIFGSQIEAAETVLA
jgi:hypothetical protein